MANREEIDTLQACIRRWRTDASAFVREMFSVNPTDQQEQLLSAISQPGARVSVKSGHGTGKSCALAWVILWFLVCFDDCKVPCTAPTGHQLHDILWAEVHKWTQKMPPWFQSQIITTKDKVAVKGNEEGQFAVARTSRKESPEALQGFHATNLLFVVDEASGVPDQIFEPMRGALSTAGARVILAANPTRCDGLFHRTHHRLKNKWTTLQFNCEESPMVSREYIEEMKQDYGEESDIYRVRVLGDFPNQSINQLIPTDLVESAMGKHLRPEVYNNAPKVLGVDVAWEGDDRSTVYLRQGLMSKCLGCWYDITQETLAGLIAQWEDEHQTSSTFIDVGWGLGVIERLRQMGRSPVAVNFGSGAINKDRYHNKRAEMWCSVKTWLEDGGVIEDDEDLRDDLVSPEYFFTPVGKICLEAKKDMKKRGLPSPDKADGLALTFAFPVVNEHTSRTTTRPQQFVSHEYKPF